MSDGAGKPATIYDVAKLAGVSHQSVSRYLRGVTGLRSETREAVEFALAKLDYRANLAARNLRRGRTGMIALTIPSLNQPYFAELAQFVIRAAQSADMRVFVETTDGDRDHEFAVLNHLRSHTVDGIIFVPSAVSADDLSSAPSSVPIVLVGDRISGVGFDHVTMSNRDGALTAVEHLLAEGRRRVVALGTEPHSAYGAATPRLEGYFEAHRRVGIAVDPSLLVPSGEWVKQAGVEAMDRALSGGLEVDAVFGFNDALALGALRSVQSFGLNVPSDVAVMGFDDTQDARYSTPSLSSINSGSAEIAARAVEMLAQRIEGFDGDARELLVDFQVRLRESTGTRSQSGHHDLIVDETRDVDVQQLM